jgi:hypothetical protein
MSEINHLKKLYYARSYSELAVNMDHLHIKRMIGSDSVYIVCNSPTNPDLVAVTLDSPVGS